MTSVLAIIQARVSSTRLPGKVMLKVNGDTLLAYQIKRLKLSSKINKIVVAAPSGAENDIIEKECSSLGIDCFRGPENDVLDRYYQCSLSFPKYKYIMRLTSDCPLIDPSVVNLIIDFFLNKKADYASNVGDNYETFPQGIGAEIFTKELLSETAASAYTPSDREHVSPFMRRKADIKKAILDYPENLSRFRLTIDYPEDFSVMKFIIENSPLNASFTHYINLLNKNPEIFKLNEHRSDSSGFKEYLQK